MQLPFVFEHVSKTFIRSQGFRSHSVEALKDVSFHVGAGEFVGLIGHNGAGKSTSIKLAMGFLRPDAGTVLVRGLPPDEVAARRRLGYVPENSSFSDFLTGAEVLEAFGAISGVPKTERQQRAWELLEALEIAAAGRRLVRTYSKGMTQRLALAQALIARPEVLILDEPMTGLDPLGRRLVIDVLLAELKRGVSMIFCSHLLADVEQLCDRIVWLNRGAVLYDGAVSQLLQDKTQYDVYYAGTAAIAGAEPAGRDRFRLRIIVDELRMTLDAVERAGGRIESFQPVTRALEEIFVEKVAQNI